MPPSAPGALFGCEIVGVNAAGQSLPALAQEVYIGPLDVNNSALAAYSYARKLSAAHTAAFVGRNSSNDPAAQDQQIGFTATGLTDEAALLRHAGENLLVQSDNILDAAWAVSSITKAPAGTSPSGEPAFSLIDVAETSRHRINQTRTWAIGATHVAAVDLKDSGLGFAQIMFNNSVSRLGVNVDLTTGATNIVAGAGTGTATSIDLGGGWWRFLITFTIATSTVGSIFIGGATSLSMARDVAYDGDDTKGILVSRPQLVSGSVAKEYARTGATPLTGTGTIVRAIDALGSRHAEQTIAASQPLIVNAGAVNMLGGRPVPSFDGVDDCLDLPTSIPIDPGIFWVAVIRTMKDNGTRDCGIITLTRQNQNSHFGGNFGGPQNWFDNLASSIRPLISDTAYPYGVNHVVSLRHTGTNLIGRVNGVEVGNTPAAFDRNILSRFIGRGPVNIAPGSIGNFAQKLIGDVVIGNGSEADVQFLERNIGASYNIAVA
jgi:hypothetical protein